MLRTFIFSGAALFIVLSSSCGTNKKLEAAQYNIDQLQTKTSELEKSNASLKGEVSDLNNRNQTLTSEFDTYKKQCKETEEKLAVVREVLTEEANTLMKVQEMIEEAMADFKDKGVDVYYRKGLVHVSLPDQLMYKSGSSALGAEGKKALGSLANVLNEYPRLKVIVLGNTDNVKYKGGGDNWTLSTERANGVVRVLRDEYKVDPTRLTAAGKSLYNPVADNTTADGRAKNRRTDIILNPDIDRIWDMAQKRD